MLYDMTAGIREDDRAARSFDYDPRPLVAGEPGAGTFAGEEFPCVCRGPIATFCLAGEPCVSL
ncbi:hypothetical protein CPT_Shaeky_048 [Streptomyces phage Shaeky]|uniref:Uncharacterized protein n=1 Tax=Streptomyces phage Shaeky TaxID=2767586 RepID=A0A873WNU6_9CAUD|nr:hypothetical protein CPT_Shaeky_048 [Streptomyces phage Shaeky]